MHVLFSSLQIAPAPMGALLRVVRGHPVSDNACEKLTCVAGEPLLLNARHELWPGLLALS